MFRFMIQKLLHKKWMFISLLIGNILLIAIVCSNPMYKNASLERMLSDNFTTYIEENNTYPTLITLQGTMQRNNGIKEFQNMEQKAETIADELLVPEAAKVSHYYIADSTVASLMGREDKPETQRMRLGFLSDIKNHVNIVSGQMYSDEISEEGYVDAIVSQRAFSELNIIIGEVYECEHVQDTLGNPLKVRITGVFESSNNEDKYWVNDPNSYSNEFFISEDIFRHDMLDYDNQTYNLQARWYVLLDYTTIKPEQVPFIISKTKEYVKETEKLTSNIAEPDYLSLLLDYSLNEKKITATLMILQVPVMVLLCSFIFMISSQMLDMEQNEIALLKSRGSGKRQIITIYLIQSIFVSLISLFIGLPLGGFLCETLGSTNAFLEFVQRRALSVTLNTEVLIYCLLAVMVSVGVMVLPVFKHANVTIVSYKQSKNRKDKKLWQRIYLDVVLLGVSLYGLYSFTQQKDILTAKVLSGSPLDPFLYLSSSLFIVGASLVALRIQPLLVKIVFLIGKKKWKPASYASFLQIIRTGSKQSFIMVFLMFTIALGIFNATVARTILSNADNNIKYQTGADLVISEVWPNNADMAALDPTVELVYKEPDFNKYEELDGTKALAIAKVNVYKNITAATDNGKVNVKLLGIDTKDFGETTWFKNSLLPSHYYNYLNILSSNANAVLVSSNFHNKYQYEVGDLITYQNKDRSSISSVIYGFVDYWPSYEPSTTSVSDVGTVEVTDNYLIVAHFAQVQESWGVTPYEIWINAKDSTDFIYDFAEKYNIKFNTFEDVSAKMVEIRNDTMFQGTNGILTMSFIVVLILCGAGFLIYWILSIRSRELLFGIFRAMGMTKKEIIFMLINEQLYSTVLSIGIGTVIGIAASRLFVPLIQIAYASTTQFIPLELVTEENDMIRLFSIIATVFILCMFILGQLISKIKISQALKLGED